MLIKDIPWLPAHDRRDVMVVQELLARLSPEMRLGSTAVQALAISAYAAAALAPCAGDGTARQRTIGAWLAERDIFLDDEAGAVGLSEAGGGPPMDVGALVKPSERMAMLPFRELRRLGWREARGSHSCCALVSPLGMLVTKPPTRDGAAFVWRANTGVVQLLAPHKLALAGTVNLCMKCVAYLCFILFRTLDHSGAIASNLRHSVEAVVRVADFCCNAALLARILVTDGARIRRGLMPFPIGMHLVRLCAVWTIALIYLAFALVIGLRFRVWTTGMNLAGERRSGGEYGSYFDTNDGGNRAIAAALDAVLVFIFVYLFVVVLIYAIGRTAHYRIGEETSVTLLWDRHLSLSDAVLGANSQRSESVARPLLEAERRDTGQIYVHSL
jgi:hypothetical protein